MKGDYDESGHHHNPGHWKETMVMDSPNRASWTPAARRRDQREASLRHRVWQPQDLKVPQEGPWGPGWKIQKEQQPLSQPGHTPNPSRRQQAAPHKAGTPTCRPGDTTTCWREAQKSRAERQTPRAGRPPPRATAARLPTPASPPSRKGACSFSEDDGEDG